MFRGKCLVIEIKDNFYEVFINDVLYQIHNVDTAREALRKALGYVYGDCDLIIHLRDKCGVFCIYDVDDVDDVDGADADADADVDADADESVNDFYFIFG